MSHSEPTITINGVRLTEAQAMTVRVAVCEFLTNLDLDCADDGADDIGRQIAKGYEARAREVLAIMLGKREVQG